MKALKNLSNVELNELQYLTDSLQNQFDRFSHISDYFPNTIKNQIETYSKKLQKEFDSRYEN